MNHEQLFYFDIETVGRYKDFKSFKLNDLRGSELFEKKYNNNDWLSDKWKSVDDAYIGNASVTSTYSKIICVSFGYFTNKNTKGYTINSIYGDNEESLMNELSELFLKVDKKHLTLSGYMINSFDIPLLVHKMNKYNIPVPNILNIYDKKPWEIQSFDLADKWKCGMKYYSSLDEVCYELNIESPKDDIDGSKVHNTYWEDNDLERIKTYCEKDVYSSMLVGKKMIN